MSDDVISRQAAIDAVIALKTEHRVSWKDAVVDTLDELPSAQPEILYCKDCKYWYTVYDDKTGSEYHLCKRNHDSYGYWYEVAINDFCSRAEREEDE